MKKQLIMVAMAAVALAAAASAPRFTVADEVDIPQGAHSPTLSPDGKTLLFSSTENHEGLCAMDLSTLRVRTISESMGAAFQPVFSADGSTVYYRTASINDGLISHDVNKFSLSNGKTKQIAKPSRRDIDLNAQAGIADYAMAAYDKIELHKGGSTAMLSPLADAHSYMWASLSPDGSRMMFSEPFKGVYVTGLDGSNPVRVCPKGDYPTWLNDEWVLVIVSHDNGYQVTDSRLYAICIADGNQMLLTPEDTLVAEVTASPATGKIAYTTMDGKLFMFNLK